MAKNSAPQPCPLFHEAVHCMRFTVSETQESTPAAFDIDANSFANLSHLPGLPPLLAKQAFHSCFFAATPDMSRRQVIDHRNCSLK